MGSFDIGMIPWTFRVWWRAIWLLLCHSAFRRQLFSLCFGSEGVSIQDILATYETCCSGLRELCFGTLALLIVSVQ